LTFLVSVYQKAAPPGRDHRKVIADLARNRQTFQRQAIRQQIMQLAA